MASAKPKKNSEPGVMDVSKPGKSAPSATSRPVIITHRPMLQDPMVSGDSGSAAEEKPAGAAMPGQKVSVQPISITVKHDGGDENTDDSAASAPALPKSELVVKPLDESMKAAGDIKEETAQASPAPVEGASEDRPEPAVQEEKPSEEAKDDEPQETPEQNSQPAAKDVAATDNPAEKAEPTGEDKEKTAASPEEQEAAAKKAEEEAAAHTAAIQKLAESREYYLPIKTFESRKTKRFILLGVVLIVVLGSAWVDVALDAGLIKVGNVKPVTHFFSN